MKFQYIKSLLALTVLSFFFFSCSVETETSFNKNFSGSTSSSLDFGEMMEFAGAFGGGSGETNPMDSLYDVFNSPAYKDSLADNMARINDEIAARGLHNFNMSMPEKGVLKTSVEFDNLEAFNNQNFEDSFGMEETSEFGEMTSMMGGTSQITMEGKWMVIKLGSKELMDLLNEQQAGGNDDDVISSDEAEELGLEEGEGEPSMNENMGMMQMFGSSVEMKSTYHFAKKIKAVETDIPYTKTKKSITFSYTMGDMFQWAEDGTSDMIRIKVK